MVMGFQDEIDEEDYRNMASTVTNHIEDSDSSDGELPAIRVPQVVNNVLECNEDSDAAEPVDLEDWLNSDRDVPSVQPVALSSDRDVPSIKSLALNSETSVSDGIDNPVTLDSDQLEPSAESSARSSEKVKSKKKSSKKKSKKEKHLNPDGDGSDVTHSPRSIGEYEEI